MHINLKSTINFSILSFQYVQFLTENDFKKIQTSTDCGEGSSQLQFEYLLKKFSKKIHTVKSFLLESDKKKLNFVTSRNNESLLSYKRQSSISSKLQVFPIKMIKKISKNWFNLKLFYLWSVTFEIFSVKFPFMGHWCQEITMKYF